MREERHKRKNNVMLFNLTEPDQNKPLRGQADDDKKAVLDILKHFVSLTQVNTILNTTGRMLDLVITDIECEVSRDLLPLVKEDAHHPSLSLLLSEVNTAYNFKRANFVGLYNALTYIDWSFLNASKDVNDMCDLFYNKLYRLLDLYVPRYIKENHKYPETTTRDSDGRFVVTLPLKMDGSSLGESRMQAERRFHSLECKLAILVLLTLLMSKIACIRGMIDSPPLKSSRHAGQVQPKPSPFVAMRRISLSFKATH
nr:unnamed protein product [Callosobruchus analis]